MTQFVTKEALAKIAVVAEAPRVRSEVDRTFELPTGLYAATAALYLGFVVVMAGAFMNAGLAVPLAICAMFIVAAFGTPMLWALMGPEKRKGAMSFKAFGKNGIMTATGRLSAGAAVVQVLILPVCILFWGGTIALIATLVQ